MLTSLTLCSITEPVSKSMTKLRTIQKQIVNTTSASKIVCARQKRLLLPGTVCFEERESELRCIGILAS